MALNEASAAHKAVEIVQTALQSKSIDFGIMAAKEVEVARFVAERDAAYLDTLVRKLKETLMTL
ncbi:MULTISPECIES: hypothetical protein [unclassified Achromobacter]|uniref:hypothetical protein n=1 Tax=unclassified Achromobacter TaxID=2626865 RepID=UPI000B51ADE3|nr:MULTISPECIES: hypothetical protein [unclassified Achromobacter]OWT69223.1 hypothetical protein CEY05_28790 [Achromobacter sp. HZ34]OWT70628.1 hypothetical protein CEY04_27620 [Achromobacter sp. HZ28]